MRIIAALFLIGVSVFYAGATRAADELAPFVSRWGKPDAVDSTEYDKPRPPMVTKWLTYRHRGRTVTVMFLAGGRVGDPPPYSEWKLIGMLDEKTQKPLTAAEGMAFLQSRKSGK